MAQDYSQNAPVTSNHFLPISQLSTQTIDHETIARPPVISWIGRNFEKSTVSDAR